MERGGERGERERERERVKALYPMFQEIETSHFSSPKSLLNTASIPSIEILASPVVNCPNTISATSKHWTLDLRKRGGWSESDILFTRQFI